MFRIDRRLVNLSGEKVNKIVSGDEAPSEETEADGQTSQIALQREYISKLELEANEKAEEIIKGAKEESADIIGAATAEAEDIRKRAWNDGFEEGSQEGKRSYDEKLAEKIAEDDRLLASVLEEVREEWDKAYSELADETVKLSLEIANKILKPPEDELDTVFLPLIKNALRQTVTDEGKLSIRVGETEFERFFASGTAKIELDSGTVVKVSVIKDTSMERGDLIIDKDDVTVNAGVDSQLKYIQLAFERANHYEAD